MIGESRTLAEPPSAGLRRSRPTAARVTGETTLRRGASLGLLFLLSLFASASVIERLVPDAPILGVTEKLEWYEHNRSRIDTVFIGSSRVHRQIRPDLFDAELAAHGFKSFSMNMGLPSLKVPEMSYLLRSMLKPDLPNPRRVFIAMESRTLTDTIADRNVGAARVVYWHDLQSTLLAVEQLWRFHHRSRENHSTWGLIQASVVHFKMYLANRLNISDGTLAVTFASAGSGHRRDGRWLEDLELHRGFSPFPEINGPSSGTRALQRRRQRFLRESENWHRRIIRKKRLYRRPQSESLDPEVVETVMHLAELVREVGGEPIFFVAPNPTVPSRWMNQIAVHEGVGTVFVYDDPNRYPQLYKADHYYDMGHLNDKGSRILTRQLALDYVSSKAGEPLIAETAGP